MMLDEKRALVTGARGIGAACARVLAKGGAHVTVTGRHEAELRALAGELGGSFAVLDLLDRAATDRFIAAHAPFDILVNNAGIAESATLLDTNDATWDRTLEVNVTAPFRLTRAVLPHMVQAGWGRVVNIASNAGLTGYAYTAAYCASKHALVGLTRSVALESARLGVTVNAICPGFVDTEMAAESVRCIAQKTGRSEADARSALESMSPQRRLVTASEVAAAALYLCSEGARGINGQTLVIDGGQVLK